MSELRIEVLADRAALDHISDAWNALALEDATPPLGQDATATYEWHRALLDAFLPDDGRWLVLVARDDRGLAGILPVYRSQLRKGLARPGEIAVLTELFGGRNGFLVRSSDASVLQALLRHLIDHVDGWDSLRMHLVCGSRSERMLTAALGGTGTFVVAEEVSPILTMPDDLDDYLRSLQPSFRSELRRREKRLHEAGSLEFEMFDSPARTAEYWQAVQEIERQSWKEAAGSALTASLEQQRFYQALLPRAAAAGQWLSGLLRLDGRPVAYRMSVVFAGTAIGLKTSYVQDMKAYSPATVLQWMYLREIHRRGIRVFDFTGLCEPHKTRWTDDTYTLRTHRIFRRSPGGQLARLRHELGAQARRIIKQD